VILNRLSALMAFNLFAGAILVVPAAAKNISVAQGRKVAIAFYKCTNGGYCHVDMCIKIKKRDGSPGRAHLYSEWTPGKSHDLDIHEGQYCDPLDFYLFMSYTLFAVPESDVVFTVGNEMVP
jgi:hypothetical protein